MRNRIVGLLRTQQLQPPPDRVLAGLEILAGDKDRRPLTEWGEGAIAAWKKEAESVRRYQVVGGDGQIKRRHTQLPVQPSVKVTDGLGRPVPRIPVNFTTPHVGTVHPGQVDTNQEGIATGGTWTLGAAVGLNEVIALDGKKPIATFRAVAI